MDEEMIAPESAPNDIKREHVVYIVNAFKQRKSAVENFASNTANALDRLIANERIDELNNVISHLENLLNLK